MLGSHFYNQIVRKNIIAFGTLFNNITMKSTDPDTGEVLEETKVPLAYGPTQKFLARLEQSPDLNKPFAITLPRMSFEITSIAYDTQRQLPKANDFNRVGSTVNQRNKHTIPSQSQTKGTNTIRASVEETAIQFYPTFVLCEEPWTDSVQAWAIQYNIGSPEIFRD